MKISKILIYKVAITVTLFAALITHLVACPEQALISINETRQVPSPAPVPWQGITAYDEKTYRIEAKAGQDFAIGILISVPQLLGKLSYDEQSFLTLVERQVVACVTEPPSGDYGQCYGTEWFLFKAIRAGKVNLRFDYPIGYVKLYEISIS